MTDAEWCRCGHRAELDPAGIRLWPSTPIPGIENKFRCAACSAKNTAIDLPLKRRWTRGQGSALSHERGARCQTTKP